MDHHGIWGVCDFPRPVAACRADPELLDSQQAPRRARRCSSGRWPHSRRLDHALALGRPDRGRDQRSWNRAQASARHPLSVRAVGGNHGVSDPTRGDLANRLRRVALGRVGEDRAGSRSEDALARRIKPRHSQRPHSRFGSGASAIGGVRPAYAAALLAGLPDAIATAAVGGGARARLPLTRSLTSLTGLGPFGRGCCSGSEAGRRSSPRSASLSATEQHWAAASRGSPSCCA
jgi:hypothetical protein